MEKYVDIVIAELNKALTDMPDGFYDSFDYTGTGKNYTHPITWGILSKIVWALPDVKHVAIDFHLNEKTADSQRNKFQPDLVALSEISQRKATLFLDYESPNSSDIRIPKKDVEPYIKWSKIEDERIPYIIMTTLPDRQVDEHKWELRWTGTKGGNSQFRGQHSEICRSPFRFWYSNYREALKTCEPKDYAMIYFINIDGKTATDVTPYVWSGR